MIFIAKIESMNTTQKATNGSVAIESFQDRLRLRLPKQVCGNNKRYIALGLADTPDNLKLAEQKANEIELDILADCFDETLDKYKQ